MTIQELATNYNMHDSLIDSFSVDDQEKTIRIIIDFAFWMQDNYSEGDPETGPLNVTFLNVSNYSVPEQLPLAVWEHLVQAVWKYLLLTVWGLPNCRRYFLLRKHLIPLRKKPLRKGLIPLGKNSLRKRLPVLPALCLNLLSRESCLFRHRRLSGCCPPCAPAGSTHPVRARDRHVSFLPFFTP